MLRINVEQCLNNQKIYKEIHDMARGKYFVFCGSKIFCRMFNDEYYTKTRYVCRISCPWQGHPKSQGQGYKAIMSISSDLARPKEHCKHEHCTLNLPSYRLS